MHQLHFLSYFPTECTSSDISKVKWEIGRSSAKQIGCYMLVIKSNQLPTPQFQRSII